MKYLIMIFVLSISVNTFAQKKQKQNKNVFIRIYNLDGKKINKGKIEFISDSFIELDSNGEKITVPLSEIGKIKTKHSGGNNIAKGILIGGGSLALMGLLSGDTRGEYVYISATDKAAIGLLGGGVAGGVFGGISLLFKNSKRFIINGEKMKLKKFKEQMIVQKLLKEIKQ